MSRLVSIVGLPPTNKSKAACCSSVEKSLLTNVDSLCMLYPMSTKEQKQIEKQIRQIKDELEKIGRMRPGSLSRQYKRPKEKKGAYYQLSYTHKMRSRTEYIRPEFVDQIRDQIAVYKRFKKLVEKWIDLAIEHSRLSMKPTKARKEQGRNEKSNGPQR